MESSIPFPTQGHDSMRLGLPAIKESIAPKHAVEVIQEGHRQQALASKLSMLRDLYGVAMPAKVEIETEILGKFQRLPGLPSSRLGLEALTGALDEFSFESFLGLPDNSIQPPVDLHSRMEQQLGLGTKPCTRAFL